MTQACSICGHTDGHRDHVAREMMFGTRDTFEYRECGGCGCLELRNPPADPAPYYPLEYYSYQPHALRRPVWLDAWLKRRRARAVLVGRDLIGSLAVRRFGVPAPLHWMRRLGVTWDDAILDVGAGAGQLLQELRQSGFRNLAGIDPYLEGDGELGMGLTIQKKHLGDEDREWDLVMLHHTLEHMPDQKQVFRDLRRIVRPGGALLIRLPVADSWAWQEYGVDWVQLDAPRHVILHTRRSLTLLATEAAFAVEHVECDSSAFQFWASEQYRRDIPLRDPRSWAVAPDRSAFTAAEIARLEAEARRLNAEGRGDQAVFYLRRAGSVATAS